MILIFTLVNFGCSGTLKRRLSSQSLHQKFTLEKGNYQFQLSDLVADFQTSSPWIQLAISKDELSFHDINQKYKLNEHNQFQVDRYYLRDPITQQNLFKLDFNAYINFFNADDFLSAKRNSYSQYPFSFHHYKHQLKDSYPAMWGGLNHPPLQKYVGPLELIDKRFSKIEQSEIEKSSFLKAQFHRDVDQKTKTHLTFQNNISLLEDHKAYEKKRELVRGAKKFIWASVLAWVCDKSGEALAKEMIKKAQQGVDVRLITEGSFIKLFHSKCPRMMRKGGVKVITANDFWKHKKMAIFHSKIWIADGSKGIIGGHNIIDADNLSRGTDFMNRDIDAYVEGPTVTDFMESYIKVWTHFRNKRKLTKYRIAPISSYNSVYLKQLKEEAKKGLRGQSQYEKVFQDKSKRLDGVCRFVFQSPIESPSLITQIYRHYLNETKTYLGIIDPVKVDTYTPDKKSFEYFNLLHQDVQKLITKGVHLDYITTSYPMSGNEFVPIVRERIVNYLNKGLYPLANIAQKEIDFANSYYGVPSYKNLLADYYPHKNVHIWNHISFIHSKVFYFDRIAFSVGSMNFQHNATDQAYESTLICQDQSLMDQADRLFILDKLNSIPFIFDYPTN